ncbi:MAG: hypothetical protein IJF11_04815 [Clostridia bacterium]|nr:hypothetical protein [Clostridia bacterium]
MEKINIARNKTKKLSYYVVELTKYEGFVYENSNRKITQNIDSNLKENIQGEIEI